MSRSEMFNKYKYKEIYTQRTTHRNIRVKNARSQGKNLETNKITLHGNKENQKISKK